MRDIVRFYSARLSGKAGKVNYLVSSEAEQEMRRNYLERFADFEGSQFLRSFYQEYRDLKQASSFERLLKRVSTSSYKQAALYRFVFPENNLEQFSESLPILNPL